MITINFFGTNDFAVGILQTLIDSGLFKIATVFTAPDRPVGRHQEIQKSPVKLLAEKYHLKIEQPQSLKNLKSSILNLQLNIVCDYGFIVPKNILDAPTHGSLNVHPSLLPKYRGASPIQSAILNGEIETGVTIMLMDELLDHGPILAQKTIKIDPTDNYTILSEKLLKTAKSLLVDTAQKWVLGPKMTPQTQDDAKATNCRELTRDDGRVDFGSMRASEIYNHYRALSPWPGVWINIKDKRLKIKDLKSCTSLVQVPAGTISVQDKQIFAAGSDGAVLELTELQLEGKKAMSASEFINGYKSLFS